MGTCNFRSTHPLIQTLLQFLINNFILISINYQRERAFVEQKRDSEESEEMEVFQRPWLCGGPKTEPKPLMPSSAQCAVNVTSFEQNHLSNSFQPSNNGGESNI